MNHDTETFNQLMADAEAGRIPWTDAVRIARSEYTDLWVARKRDSMTITAVRRFESGCAAQIRAALRYSDADLDDMERRGREHGLPGLEREAIILRRIPNQDDRAKAVRDAHHFRNMTPDAGRWSDALATCARSYGG